jgi:cytochrome c oxidase assembly protein subunit 11
MIAPVAPRAVRADRRSEETRRRNRALLAKLGVIVVAMFGFGYALVPLYEKICEVTGLRDIDRADSVVNTQVDRTRFVRIEFDTNLHAMPWKFRALETTTDVHPGAVTQVLFEVVNTTDHPVTGQAIPSYGPRNAARYFRKLDCFCFAKQTLAAGETRRMPVVFVIDPEVPKDLATITLSYTFFMVEGSGSDANFPKSGKSVSDPERVSYMNPISDQAPFSEPHWKMVSDPWGNA